VEQLLKEREQEALLENGAPPAKAKSPRKRKEDADISPKPKKAKSMATAPPMAPNGMGKVVLTLKLGPRPDMEPFVCCLCVSMEKEGLLPVHDPPIGRVSETCDGKWMAHEQCANVIPETWVDEVEVENEGERKLEKMVFGVDAIVKDRWNLVRKYLYWRDYVMNTHVLASEMFCLFQGEAEGTRRSNTMYKREMSQSLSCLLCKEWGRSEHNIRCPQGG
jgi:hypothetical protein